MRKTLLVFLVVFLMVSASAITAAVLYSLEKPMGVYVAGSDGETELYSNLECTVAIDQIDYDSMVPGMTKNSSVMYLRNQGVSPVSITWITAELPSDCVLRAFYGVGGSETVWAEWTRIGLQPSTQCPVKFELHIAEQVTMLQLGTYHSWTLKLESSS